MQRGVDRARASWKRPPTRDSACWPAAHSHRPGLLPTRASSPGPHHPLLPRVLSSGGQPAGKPLEMHVLTLHLGGRRCLPSRWSRALACVWMCAEERACVCVCASTCQHRSVSPGALLVTAGARFPVREVGVRVVMLHGVLPKLETSWCMRREPRLAGRAAVTSRAPRSHPGGFRWEMWLVDNQVGK